MREVGAFEAKNKLEVPRTRRVVLNNGDAYWEWWVSDNWRYFSDTPF